VTTDAFRRIMADAPSTGGPLDRLSRLSFADREAIRTLSAEIRMAVVVQQMVFPQAAGILFTADPVQRIRLNGTQGYIVILPAT
jgi:hypothetical protein